MKVLYDNQIFYLQNFGGISRYFYELIRNLDKEIDYDLSIAFSNNFYLKSGDIAISKPFLENTRIKGKTSVIKFFNQRLQQQRFKYPFDIFHPTYNNPYFLDQVKTPFVFTIHDMTHELFSLKTKKNDWSVEGKKILASKAHKIIAVSENTKRDVINILGIKPDKIEVIYHGCSLKPSMVKTMNLPDRYILYVGDRGGYKNFDRLALAFSLIQKQDSDLKLICTGKPFNSIEYELFRSLNIEKNLLNYNVNDQHLSELYSSALTLVFPSLYEGFGIPILEAFTCGCPVVLSNVSCFPEIVKDAGVFCNPLDIDSIALSIKKVIYDPDEQKRQIEKGLERLKEFSWKKTAQETSLLYKSILES